MSLIGMLYGYYESGMLKMKGHFKNDKRDGLWRLYDEEGELILRRNYEDGKLKRERAANNAFSNNVIGPEVVLCLLFELLY